MKEDIFHLGVKALLRNEEGKILLLQVNTTELKNNTHGAYWDLPGGRIHRGDTVEATLRREVMEEAGIDAISSVAPLMMVLSPLRIPVEDSDVGLILAVYVCSVSLPVQIKLSNEHVKAEWFTPAEAAELLKIKYPTEITKKIATL